MSDTDYRIPPAFRFIMEISSWVWMLLLDWLVLLISLVSLALLNVKGDKKSESDGVIGLAVPGPVRLFVELLTAILGVLYAYYFGIYPALLQLGLVLVYLKMDWERLRWLAGRRPDIPKYILQLHSANKKMK